jgi:hypothetical protein
MFTAKFSGFNILAVFVLSMALVFAILVLPRAFVNTGLLAVLHGNDELARNSLKLAYSISPNNRSLLIMYIDRLSEQGRYGDVVSALERYLTYHPADQTLQLRVVESAARNGDVAKAERAWLSLSQTMNISSEAAAVLANDALKTNAKYPLKQTVGLTALALHWSEGERALAPLVKSLLAGNPTKAAKRLHDAIQWRAGSVVQSNKLQPTQSNMVSMDTSMIARMLNVHEKQILLGPNLVTNGGFELTDQLIANPEFWRPVVWDSAPLYNELGYVLGTDLNAFGGNVALYIAVPIQTPLTGSLESSRVGVWHQPLVLKPGSTYAISFVYKATDDILRLYFSDQRDAFLPELWLPKTTDVWKRAVVIATNQSTKPLTIQPLIRVWGEGIVQFDDLSINEIIAPANLVQTRTLLNIYPADMNLTK